MEADIASGLSLLVQGDFNHTPSGSEYPRWIESCLTDTFAEIGDDAVAGCTLLRPQPCARLDYVLVAGPLRDRLIEARPLFEEEFRLYSKSPDAVSLSDHLPQYARFHD